MDRVWLKARNLLGAEIPLFLYMLSSYLEGPVFQNLIFEKVCLQRYYDYDLCTNVSAYYEDQHIQSDANHFYSISSYTLIGPSVIVSMFLGVATDYLSPKICLLIPFFGSIVGSLNYIIQSVYIDSSVYLLLISDAAFGICGGYIGILSTTMSYSVKRTATLKRSYRIAALEGSIGLGGTIGFATSGMVRQSFGYAYTYLLVLILQFIAFYYILIVTDDENPNAPGLGSQTNLLPQEVRNGAVSPVPSLQVTREKRSCSEYAMIVLRVPIQGLGVIVRERTYRLVLVLLMLSLGAELLIFSGLSDIQYSYLRFKLSWGDKEYGWFSGLSFGLTTLAILILYPLLRSKGASDGKLALAGMIFKMASLFMFAFVQNIAMAYSIAVVQMLNRFVSSGFRAFMSRLIEDDEQGQLFSVIAIFEGVVGIVASAIYNNLYPLTLSFFPGLCYVISGCLLIPSILILGISDNYMVREWNNVREEEDQNPDITRVASIDM